MSDTLTSIPFQTLRLSEFDMTGKKAQLESSEHMAMTGREDFERWYVNERPEISPHLLLSRVVSDERYEMLETEWAWKGWNAAESKSK